MPFPAKTSTDAIIQSATDIIQTGGLASLSMRNLAARLGVRASSLYRHFPDRSSIEKTVASRAAEQLLARMRLAVQDTTGEQAVFAACRAYLEYATSEAAFYNMIMDITVPGGQQNEASKRIWEFFVRLVSEATALDEDLSGAAALWSLLHGFTFLSRTGQFGETPAKPAFARGTQALVRGLAVADKEDARSQSQSAG